MASIDEIAKQFTDYYYQTFDTTRELKPLYVRYSAFTKFINLFDDPSPAPSQRDTSMLSWEGTPMQGAPAIEEKLKVIVLTSI
jgi:hypothetical protein